MGAAVRFVGGVDMSPTLRSDDVFTQPGTSDHRIPMSDHGDIVLEAVGDLQRFPRCEGA